MKKIRTALALVAAAMLTTTTGSAVAAEGEHPFDQYVTDALVAEVRALSVINIHLAMCEDNVPCEAASETEIAEPPISIEQTRAAMKTGIISALMEWCELDWERRSFAPLMLKSRDIDKLTDRQMSLLGVAHGIQQGRFGEALADAPVCADASRRKLHAQMPGAEIEKNPSVSQ